MNTWNQFDAAVPFGGYKMSGIGREHGEEVLSHYTQVSSLHLCHALAPLYHLEERQGKSTLLGRAYATMRISYN